jgi:microcystin-dependent protein
MFGGGVTPTGAPSGGGTCVLGQIQLFADASAETLPPNYVLANGQVMSISLNTALYQTIGTTYGGDGNSTFKLPNLQAADPKGDGPAAPAYAICIAGTFP